MSRLGSLVAVRVVLAALSLSACSDDGGAASGPPTSNGTGGAAGTTSGAGGGGSSGSTGGGSGASGGPSPGGAAGTSIAPPKGSVSGPIRHHTYAFDLASAHAKSTLTIDVASPGGDCFSSDLAVSAVSDARWNGAPAASAVVAKNELSVCGQTSVGPGLPLVVSAELDVPTKRFLGLDIGFSRRPDRADGTFSYLLSWVGGCSHFGPCEADPAGLSTFRFDVDHATSDVVLCPGKRTVSADGKRTTCVLDQASAPTYSAFGLAADPLWQRRPFAQVAGVDIVFFEVPGGTIADHLDVATFTSFFTWITDLLGPFPYGDELRFAGGPTKWLGFEHPANVVLFEDLGELDGPYANPPLHVVMHEVIHQWAGDRTTIATAVDFVWKEAIAEYLAYVFEDEHQPPEEAVSARRYWKQASLQAKTYPRPEDAPAPKVETFYGDVYGPGPMVLFIQLEPLLGREAVLAGIKAFLAEPGARSVADLRAALATASGQDLQPYFDAWVFGSGAPTWPTFAATTTRAGDDVTVTVEQVDGAAKLHGCKVEVLLEGETERVVATVDFGLAPTESKSLVTVKMTEPLLKTTVDPEHRVVARSAGPSSAPLVPVQIYPL